MKSKLILLLCLLVSQVVPSQTIHWIIFGATNDPVNGAEVENSISAYNSQFVDRINDALRPKGYTPSRYVYKGLDFTESKCKGVINSLSCGQDDIIVFYYLGHGGRAQVEKSAAASYNSRYPWPDLAFECGSNKVKASVFTLDNVHNLLKKKNARLTITIGMCCNRQTTQYKRQGQSPQSRKYKIVSKRFAKKVAQRLFLKYKGDVLLSSAKPGEISNGGYVYNEKEVDFFTASLCEVMDKYANSDTGDNASWASFLSEVSGRCSHMVLEEGNKCNETWIQTPQRKNNTVLIK